MTHFWPRTHQLRTTDLKTYSTEEKQYRSLINATTYNRLDASFDIHENGKRTAIKHSKVPSNTLGGRTHSLAFVHHLTH